MSLQRNQKINQILDVSGKLFETKGYDNTSINDILRELGIAKGTLYHYFDSKEEILNSLVERMNDEIQNKALLISNNKEQDILGRMLQTIMSLNIEKDGNSEDILNVIHQPQNALMHQKIEDTILSNITPIMSSLVEEGIEEGLFTTSYPFYASEMLLSYSLKAFSNKEEDMQKKMAGFIYNMERLLGAEEGN